MELFHRILSLAIESGASDVHVKIGGAIIFRIHSQLTPIEAPVPTAEWMDSILQTIVPRYVRTRLEHDHEVDFSYYAQGIGRFRTNVFQQRGQFCLSMRYVKTKIPSFAELNLLEVLKTIAESPRGIVLVAGTTGCGKSTSLAAMVQHINTTNKRHVITLEDPIEYVFEDAQSVIEQREVGLDTLSFEHGLKHVLRQDPDIIMIGEMRDSISFQAAMSAADTGHLVLSTLHTTDAPQSIGRILDFFKTDERDQIRRQLSGTLQAVVVQRMVLGAMGGVIPSFEIMINTGTVRKLLEENRLDKLGAAIETGTEEGMLNFNQSLFNLVKERKVTEKEALSKATNPAALEMNFKGIFLDEGRRILG